jgi:hypothetical protein
VARCWATRAPPPSPPVPPRCSLQSSSLLTQSIKPIYQ